MELVTRASAAASCSKLQISKIAQKTVAIAQLPFRFTSDMKKTANPKNPTTDKSLCIPLLCVRGKLFSGQGWCGFNFFHPQVGGKQCSYAAASPPPWNQKSSSRLQNVYRRSLPSSPTTLWVKAEKCKWQCSKNMNNFLFVWQDRKNYLQQMHFFVRNL